MGVALGTCEAQNWVSVFNPGPCMNQEDNPKTRRTRYWERWYKKQLTDIKH